jgi:hypothetical protein
LRGFFEARDFTEITPPTIVQTQVLLMTIHTSLLTLTLASLCLFGVFRWKVGRLCFRCSTLTRRRT